MNAPCKKFNKETGKWEDCQIRRPGCHSKCKDYLVYREKLDKVAKERIKQGVITGYAKEKRTRVMKYFRRAGIDLGGK